MRQDPKPKPVEEEEELDWDDDDLDIDDMDTDLKYQKNLQESKQNHPGHSDNAHRTGAFLGVNFPYVPGDPFW
jgi:hypothetical protein